MQRRSSHDQRGQVFEATDFVLRDRPLDTSANVVLLQVSALGERYYSTSGWKGRYCGVLKEKLLRHYSPDFRAIFYTAPHYVLCEPAIIETTLGEIDNPTVRSQSTLYLPPSQRAPLHLSAIRKIDYHYLLDSVDLTPLEPETKMQEKHDAAIQRGS